MTSADGRDTTSDGADTAESRRLKVVHVSSVHNAGDTRVLYRECETIAAFHSVELVALSESTHLPANLGTVVHEVNPASGVLSRLRNVFRVSRLAWSLDGDVYHLHDPELVLFALALQFKPCRIIFDLHEDFPAQLLNKPSVPARLRRIASHFGALVEKAIALISDVLVVADPSNVRKFSREVVVVQNFTSEVEFPPAGASEGNRSLDLVYVGGLNELRGLREMLDLVADLDDLGCRLVLAGECQPSNALSVLERHPGYAKVTYLGVVDRQRLSTELGRAAIGLALLHDVPNYRHSQPTKVFEYAAAGLPVIASDLDGWRPLFSKSLGVRLLAPDDRAGLERAARELLADRDLRRHLGELNRLAFEANWTWSSQASVLLSAYSKLAESGLGSVRTRGWRRWRQRK